MNADTYTPAEVVWALQLYMYNVSPNQRAKRLCQSLWPGAHPTYVAEWAERMARRTTAIPGVDEMDSNTLTRYVDQALEVYGREAKAQFSEVSDE